MFWIIAVAVLTLAGLVLAWPLLARGSNWKAAGLALLIVLPLGGALLYRDVGAPAAINAEVVTAATDADDFNAMVDNLRARLTEAPGDLDGWLLLGRSLKSMQRYDEALAALETARQIAPDDPSVSVELAEAILFTSGDPRISDEVRAMLQSAVDQDPQQQKGLWLLGIDAVQRGDDGQAIEIWQRLLVQIPSGSPVADTVEEQINEARGRLGMAPAGPSQDTADIAGWPGIAVEVSLGEPASRALPTPLPDAASLFIIVRPAGQSGGPPLGVARVNQPAFPLTIPVDDRNAMLPQRKLSDQERLSIQARLSLSGAPGASPGDWESATAEATVDGTDTVTLTLGTEID